ncbi:hypothetical protein [Novosphingobium sp.]|uniref:hypothetical protein n=1 Tax=Novosphingobium sp. TaxID=1874826 RepID=UPI0026050E19|nr:hypothetical protein [Novosphingobium sp.]
MTRLLFSPSLVVVLAPVLLLGACGKSSAPQAGPTASGEVLPGTVSDAMLETDRSQALAPLAPAAHSAAARPDASTAADASEAASDPAAPAEATPAGEASNRPKPAASAKLAVP